MGVRGLGCWVQGVWACLLTEHRMEHQIANVMEAWLMLPFIRTECKKSVRFCSSGSRSSRYLNALGFGSRES